ncbi:MAG TPA: hypothetical protein V6D22_21375, partial [Candidatus Obscuribacterales bacterium]
MDIPKRVSHGANQPHPETGASPHQDAETNHQPAITGAHPEHPNAAAHQERGVIKAAIEPAHDQAVGGHIGEINLCSLTTGENARLVPLLQESTATSKLPQLEVSADTGSGVGYKKLAVIDGAANLEGTPLALALVATAVGNGTAEASGAGSGPPNIAKSTAKLAALGESAPLAGLGSTLEPPVVPDAPVAPTKGESTSPASASILTTNLDQTQTIPQPGSIVVATLESAPLSPVASSPVPLSPAPLSPAPLEPAPISGSPVDVAAATAKLASLGSAPLAGLGSTLEPPVVPAAPVAPTKGESTIPASGSILTTNLDQTQTIPQPGSIVVASLESAPLSPVASSPVPLSPAPLSPAPLEQPAPISGSPVDVAAATAKLASLGSAPLAGLGSTLEPPV